MSASLKKTRKANRDSWVPSLVVSLASEQERWALAARRSGLTLNQWIRDRLNRIAPSVAASEE
jgi:hypothetical protein